MKKATILLLAATTVSLSVFAQPSKWFVSVSSGVPFCGPSASIKSNMKHAALDYTGTYDVLFGLFSGTVSYPISSKNPTWLLKVGKRLTDKRSLYIMAGVSSSGEVEGFKKVGYDSYLDPLFSGSYGVHVNVKYKIYQVAAGYQYSYANTRAKIAIAPSVFVFKYENTYAVEAQGHTAIVPGVAFTGRLPLGREKRLIGVDLVAELNLAPPVKMKTLSTEATFDDKTVTAVLPRSSVNMIHGMLGFALSFRR